MIVNKRGGSTQTGLTGTVWPTSPPASTQHHGHQIPKIAGSSGGFLGLVIGLGVLIIACCIGVYILLKKRKDRGEPLWRKPKFTSFSAPKRSNKGWVRTGDGDDDTYTPESRAAGGIGLSAPRSRSRSPNPPYETHAHTSSASTVKLGPYPDAWEARDSIDSLVEQPYAAGRGKYEGVDDTELGADPTKHSPTSPDFGRGTRFKEVM